MSHLISATALIEALAEERTAGGAPSRLCIIDASFVLTDPSAGRRAYDAGHLPGAVYFDLDNDLSDPEALARHHAGVPGAGGRHPLPDMRVFAAKLAARGIGNDHTVVVYDQDGGIYAARAWWLLRYAGHDRVRFLNGGARAFVAAGGELTTEVPHHDAARFELDLRESMVMSADELRSRATDSDLVVVDVRAAARYRGETEPLDAKAGHVPGAINVPYTSTIDAVTGELLVGESLGDALAPLLRAPESVAYCGSGVSAAHLILACSEAGADDVKLYPGSWSDWSSRPDWPVATGDAQT
ncbi:MAG: sulfurtransferase [Trueperaceae bacterium]|nr:sulfurtransferase [Trueperaceae bacterium]